MTDDHTRAADNNSFTSAERSALRVADIGECVELSNAGVVRDSKNPAGPVLRTDLGGLLATVKTGRFDR